MHLCFQTKLNDNRLTSSAMS